MTPRNWKAFRKGVLDGLTGGPLWCFLGWHVWRPIHRIHPQQRRFCCRCGAIQPETPHE